MRLTKEQCQIIRDHNGPVVFTFNDLLDTIDALETEKSASQTPSESGDRADDFSARVEKMRVYFEQLEAAEVEAALVWADRHFKQFWLGLCKLEPGVKYLSTAADKLAAELREGIPSGNHLAHALREARRETWKLAAQVFEDRFGAFTGSKIKAEVDKTVADFLSRALSLDPTPKPKEE